MKAFLSHSSLDKPFVEQVAKHLGREYIVYDAASFDHGEGFRAEIAKGLGKSNVFVFFLSRSSLKSFYVDLELDEARQRVFDHEILKAFSIRLDNSIKLEELPHWLRRINAPFIQSSAIAARLIKDHVNALKREVTPDLLIGRAQDIARVEQVLTPLNHRPPGIVALWGLPGIGRRAIAKRVLRDIMDLQRPLPLNIESGDSIADLRLKLTSSLDTPKDSETYLAIQRVVESAREQENIAACLGQIGKAQAGRELVMLVDQGGLLDEEGELLPDFRNLILAIFSEQTLRCILVSRRRLAPIELEEGLRLPNVRIDRLSDDSTRTLLQQLGAREQITLSPQELETLSSRVAGYPPAAYHAIGLIKDYGRELILRDAKEIINFRETSFLQLLQKENKFTETQRKILGLLPNFDSLPLPVLGRVTNVPQEEVDRDAMRLVDLALLTIDADGFYAVSDPVREVTHKVFGRLDAPYAEIADSIDEYLSARQVDPDDRGIPLSLIRARFKAHVLAGRDRKELFYMVSDLIQMQETLYHDQDYDRSIQMGREVLGVRPDQLDALKYIARAQTQLEHYDQAQKTIDQIKRRSGKEAKFLEGFLMRKSGRIAVAIVSYNDALALGMKGVAIQRELGQCLFLEGRFSEAREHLAKAREADPTNKFVLDYDIQVAIAEERFADARSSIPQLAQVEEESRVQHRLSTLESAVGDFEAAFVAADRAIRESRRPQFEVITQYVSSAIRTKRLTDARKGLEMLGQRFHQIRKDIQNGLWARYFLARGDVEDASAYWSKIRDKDSEIHRRIREDIVDTMLRNLALVPDERTKLEKELALLRKAPRRKGLEALATELS